MIRFSLRCENEHQFESWFKDGAAYDRMAEAGLVECPTCGEARVSKALMTPAVAKAPGVKGRAEAPPALPAKPPAPPAEGPHHAAGPMPAQVVALLQRMRHEIETNCDYVGPDFAKEARRIHEGEVEARGIYGEASDEEAEALRDDGIDIARLPWVPRSDG
ncbi:DUF1178 family protein [Roseococcus sp. SYP-B2431]|uniref:DUF1178 family protein n=1 Tax=Roseococcus sp. SYP-B2431 TaxID=2496640 RepID=UPI00103D3D4B|nr:DUF1178 family protein [Roseococcus sp. SYP-B2431]TCH98564.1 DUF1178 family protein [Roseococcus sp. SYP-B2431]